MCTTRRFKAYDASAWACKLGGWTTLFTDFLFAGPTGLVRTGYASDAGSDKLAFYSQSEAFNHFFDYYLSKHYTYSYNYADNYWGSWR